jgi:hypothetical protein
MNAAPEPVPVADDTPAVTPLPDDAGLWRRRRWLRICVRVFLALIVLGGGVKLWALYALKSELAALRAAGEPTTWAELLAQIEPIPDEENSALVLAPAMASLEEWEYSPIRQLLWGRRDAELGTRLSDEMQEIIRIALAESAADLATLHAAAKHERGRWPMCADADFDERHYPSFLPGMWRATRLLSTECELRAAEGDQPDAALAVLVCLRLAGSLDRCPSLEAFSRRLLCAATACRAVETALSIGEMSARDTAMLRAEFAAEAERMDLRDVLRADLVNNLWLTKHERSRVACLCDSNRYNKDLDKFMVWVPGVIEWDALCGLRHAVERRALLGLSERRLLAETRILQDRMTTMRERWQATVLTPVSATRAAFFYDPLWKQVRIRQRLHVARTALAVEQFRTERGRWPESLADLVPDYLDAVPQDWLGPDGTTVSYARTATGARLWTRADGEESTPGLTARENRSYMRVVHAIERFKKRKGRLPQLLSEVEDPEAAPFQPNPFTGKPYSYVTNAANPELFIFGGFTDGMAQSEFWKQTLTTEEWVRKHGRDWSGIMFRLLNPELRGATQARLADEIDCLDPEALHSLGYTAERLLELGFVADAVKEFESGLRRLREEEGHMCENCESLPTPQIPADTEMEPMP